MSEPKIEIIDGDVRWELTSDGKNGYYQVGWDKDGHIAGLIYCPYIPISYIDVSVTIDPKSQNSVEQK